MGNNPQVAEKIKPNLRQIDLQRVADFEGYSFLDSLKNSQNKFYIFNRSGKTGGYCITTNKLIMESKSINNNFNAELGTKVNLMDPQFSASLKYGTNVNEVFKNKQKISAYQLHSKVNTLGLNQSNEERYLTIWQGPNKQTVKSLPVFNYPIKIGQRIHLLLKKTNSLQFEEQKQSKFNSQKIRFIQVQGKILRWLSLFIKFYKQGNFEETTIINQISVSELNLCKVINYDGGCFFCGYYKDQTQDFKYSPKIKMVFCQECIKQKIKNEQNSKKQTITFKVI